MKIASERSLNKAIVPVPNRKKVEFPFTIDKSLLTINKINNFSCTKNWTSTDFMMIDIITDLSFNRFYQKTFNCGTPNSPFSAPDQVFIKTDNFGNNNGVKDFEMKLSISVEEIKLRYPFVSKYTSLELYNMLKNASNCKFIFPYECRTLLKSGKKKIFPVKMFESDDYKNLFDVEISDSIKSEDGKILDMNFCINFLSSLSILYFKNIISVNVDWLDDKIYNLSEYSQHLYRKVILISTKKKIEVRIQNVVDMLNLSPDATSYVYVIKRALNELLEKKFIKSYSILKVSKYKFLVIEK